MYHISLSDFLNLLPLFCGGELDITWKVEFKITSSCAHPVHLCYKSILLWLTCGHVVNCVVNVIITVSVYSRFVDGSTFCTCTVYYYFELVTTFAILGGHLASVDTLYITHLSTVNLYNDLDVHIKWTTAVVSTSATDNVIMIVFKTLVRQLMN